MTGRITITAEVVGIGSDGTEPSIVFAVHRHGVYSADRTLLKRYLFNCGEGTQRLCGENSIKLNSLDSIFLTRLDVRSASGIPGLVFALGGLGAAHLRVHGPSGTRDRLTAMESFVRRKYPQIECLEVEANAIPQSDTRSDLSGIAKRIWSLGHPLEDSYARILAVPISSGSGAAPACWICEKCTPLKAKPTTASTQPPRPSDSDLDQDQDPDQLWLRRFYESKGLGEKIPHMDAILRRYRGRMGELKIQLMSKYGTVVDSGFSSPSSESGGEKDNDEKVLVFDAKAPLDREWLEAFYQRYEPVKAGRVDQILRQFAGREDQLKDMLLAKYGGDKKQADESPAVKKQKTGHNPEESAKTENRIPERLIECEEVPLDSSPNSSQQPRDALCYILQFLSPPFPVVWIVDCQSADQIELLSRQLVASECGHQPVLVIHFSPIRVLHHPKYHAWIQSLGGPSAKAIEHLVFDGRALRAVDNGIFSFAFVASARHYLKNEADASLPESSRWQSLRDLLKSRLQPSLQLRIRPRFGSPPISGDIAQAKLQYVLHETAIVDYSQTGWKHAVERKVGDNHEDASHTQPNRQTQLVTSGLQLSILGTGSAAPSKLRAATSMYLSLSPAPMNGLIPGMLIDCGEGAYGQLQRQFDTETKLADRLAGLRCIWISHHHADHQCGLLRVLDEYVRVTQNAPKDQVTLFVIAPQSVLAYATAWLPNLPSSIRLLTCAEINDHPPDFKLHMRDVVESMRSVRVWHCHDAFGLVLRLHDGRKLVYSGDTKPCDQLVRAGMDASLLIHEATFDDSMEEDADKKKHTTVGQAIVVARRMRAKRLVLTHFSQRYPALPPPMSNSATANSDHATPEIFCAYDGLTISV